MRCTAGLLTSLAACTLVIGCGGESRTEDDVDTDSVIATVGNDSITVVFQMTGLMLAVPPRNSGDPLKVVMPRTVAPNQHFARVGFGGDSTSVCDTYHRPEEICYVDLEKWSLDPVGGHLAPQDLRNPAFPRGVVNVSRGVGGGHTVRINGNGEVFTQVGFLAGHPRADACRLATWSYTPAGQTPGPADTISLVNVMNWDIRHPRNVPFELTFRPRSPNTGNPVTVPLISSDSVYVVLAHVPNEDLAALPPGMVTPADVTTPARLEHVRDLYRLLHHPGTQQPFPPAQGPVPTGGTPIDPRMCPLRMTTSTSPLAPLGRAGIKTYGCVVGTGEG
jgi:hypothetical protein